MGVTTRPHFVGPHGLHDALLSLFELHLDAIVSALGEADFVELTQDALALGRRRGTPPADAAGLEIDRPAADRDLVGETGFEPAAARPPAGCATRLRHSPWCSADSTTQAAACSTWASAGLSPERARAARQLPPLCRAAYKQEHYAAVARATSRTRCVANEPSPSTVRPTSTEFFRLRPCVDCVETDPLVLELDRRESKLFTISKGLRDHNWQAVIDELAKCDVVCANCHRRRTARRGGSARAVVAQR